MTQQVIEYLKSNEFYTFLISLGVAGGLIFAFLFIMILIVIDYFFDDLLSNYLPRLKKHKKTSDK